MPTLRLIFCWMGLFCTVLPAIAEAAPEHPVPCALAQVDQSSYFGTNSHDPNAPAANTPAVPTAKRPGAIKMGNAVIPAPLIRPTNIIPLGCDRPFIYRNEVYSADPPQAQDASTLKYFMADVPEANSILADYQNNRNRSKISAYTGTFGLLVAVLSGPITQAFHPADRDKDAVRGLIRLGGLGLAAGGFIYSFTLLRSNESLIRRAVDVHNQAKPDDPIELQFTTGWTF